MLGDILGSISCLQQDSRVKAVWLFTLHAANACLCQRATCMFSHLESDDYYWEAEDELAHHCAYMRGYVFVHLAPDVNLYCSNSIMRRQWLARAQQLANNCARGWREMEWCIVKQLVGPEKNNVL